MRRPLFFILLILGVIGFCIMAEMEIKYYAAYGFLYFGIVFEIRRWYLRRQLKLPWWYWWNPLNIFDQFKKP